MISLVYLIFLFNILCPHASCLKTLVINAVGTKTTDRVDAIFKVIETLDDLINDNYTSHIFPLFNSRVLFSDAQAFSLLPLKAQNHIKIDLNFSVKFYSSRPLIDHGIGRPEKVVEQVSAIFESLIESSRGGDDIVALSFSNRSVPVFKKNFARVFEIMESFPIQVLLLGKTRRLSSVSDWHDLQIIALSSSNSTVVDWLKTVNSTYVRHADRSAYSMLEPRPAILEANLQFRNKIKIDFFPDNKICAIAWDNGESSSEHDHDYELRNSIRYIHDHHLEHFHDKRCSNGDSFVEIFCGSGNHHEDHICATPGDPVFWKTAIGNPMTDLSEKLHVPKKQWGSKLPDGMDAGSLRFYQSQTVSKPRDFCWDTGRHDFEDAKQSVIYENFDKTRPFIPKNFTAKVKAAVVTGDHGSWRSLDNYLHQSVGKMYYARRHGYDFALQFSNQFVAYYPHDLFSTVGRPDPYFKGVMSKTLMTLDAMYRFPDAEWIMFIDSDAWFNSEWLDTPLDAFLEDVPDDKLWVQTNYRSMLTGVFFVRNNIAGRDLVRDWVAVGMSGQVSCHGFDQAAIMVLFMLRQAEKITERPYGFSCLSNDQKSSETGLFGTGCFGSDWSCDYKFEYKMNEMGFKTRRNGYFNDSFSSYSRGCANNYVKDFHVTYETEFRPRLQCFHCGKSHEIESLEWDGPIGGGNELVRMGAVNAYFTNHKANWLFYEQYLNPNACKKLEFLEFCNAEMAEAQQDADQHSDERDRETMYSKYKHGRRLVSLVDGIAIDLDTGIFCKLELNSTLASLQRTTTYMKDYSEAIQAASTYNSTYWDQQYHTQGQSQSRVFCKPSHKDECTPDGLNWRKKDGNWFLANKKVCTGCKIVSTMLFGLDKKAVDCSSNIPN